MAPATAIDPAQDIAQGEIPSEMEVLIRTASVLSEPEKQYWIDLLPSLDQEQEEQLRDILGKSQGQMEKVNEKYDGKMKAVSEKLVQKWDSQKAVLEKEIRDQEEAKGKVKADEKAEELLGSWE